MERKKAPRLRRPKRVRNPRRRHPRSCLPVFPSSGPPNQVESLSIAERSAIFRDLRNIPKKWILKIKEKCNLTLISFYELFLFILRRYLFLIRLAFPFFMRASSYFISLVYFSCVSRNFHGVCDTPHPSPGVPGETEMRNKRHSRLGRIIRHYKFIFFFPSQPKLFLISFLGIDNLLQFRHTRKQIKMSNLFSNVPHLYLIRNNGLFPGKWMCSQFRRLRGFRIASFTRIPLISTKEYREIANEKRMTPQLRRDWNSSPAAMSQKNIQFLHPDWCNTVIYGAFLN